MKHASARMKVYTFSHPQYERIANTRGWRSFIFGLALAERQRAAPISDQASFQHTSVSTCISVLQYLRLSTGVLAYRYWSTEPSVLTRRERKILRKRPHTANANPKIKLYYSEKHPSARRKNQKSPIPSVFFTFWRHLAPSNLHQATSVRQKEIPQPPLRKQSKSKR